MQIDLYKYLIYRDLVFILIRGCLNVQKSINVIDHIHSLKEKHDMIISIDAQKGFNKIRYLCMIKTQ